MSTSPKEKSAAAGARERHDAAESRPQTSIWRGYSYGWVTLAFFLLTLAGHWVFGWFSYIDEQQAHGQPIQFSKYLIEISRDTLENWQSEFLQLLWQVGGLAMLLYVGSPQSKEGHDRIEAKIDELLKRADPKNAERVIKELDDAYAGRHTDARHAHR
jgi:hypothetical protein